MLYSTAVSCATPVGRMIRIVSYKWSVDNNGLILLQAADDSDADTLAARRILTSALVSAWGTATTAFFESVAKDALYTCAPRSEREKLIDRVTHGPLPERVIWGHLLCSVTSTAVRRRPLVYTILSLFHFRCRFIFHFFLFPFSIPIVRCPVNQIIRSSNQ
jgi:hypothetical protein